VDDSTSHIFAIEIIFVLRIGISVYSFISDGIENKGAMISA
jgi:hypothetical protein